MCAWVYGYALLLSVILFTSSYGQNVIYRKTFGGSGHDNANAIITTKDHKYLLVGSTAKNNDKGSDIYIVKADAFGELVWARIFGGKGNDVAHEVIEYEDHHYLIGCSSQNDTTMGMEIYLIYLGKQGIPIWEKHMQGSFNDMIKCKDGTVAILGKLNRGCINLFKINTSGDEIWSKEIPTTIKAEDSTSGFHIDIYGNAFCEKEDGGFIVAGSVYYGGFAPYLASFDTSGTILWEKGAFEYDQFHSASYSSIALSKDNHILLSQNSTYRSDVTSSSSSSTSISKFSTDKGEIIWLHPLKESGNSKKILCLPNNTIIVLSNLVTDIAEGIGLFNLTPSGEEIYSYKIDNNFQNFSYAYDAIETANGHLLICGQYSGSGDNSQILLLKFNPYINPDEKYFKYRVPSVYPNPFFSIINIEIELDQAAVATIQIYDLNGRLVQTLLNQTLSENTYQIPWKPYGCAAGIYFISVTIDNYYEIKKCIYLGNRK